MRTITKSILMLFLSVAFASNVKSQITTPNVDSIFNLISGNWHEIKFCGENSILCPPSTINTINQLERIVGTDSVLWKVIEDNQVIKETKYLVAYAEASQKWVKNWRFFSGETANYIYVRNGEFFFHETENGGNYKSFSREELKPNFDSISKALCGVWYKYIDCSGLTGVCDSVTPNQLYQFDKIEGTDSIIWNIYNEDVMTTEVKCLLAYANSLHGHSWKLFYGGPSVVINIDSENLTVSLDAFDGGASILSQQKPKTSAISNLDSDNSKLTLLPNPTSNSFTIQNINEFDYINIIDISGKLLQTINCKNTENPIDLSNYPKGFYFIKAFHKNKVHIGKIIKN